jgi:hypothetical protein
MRFLSRYDTEGKISRNTNMFLAEMGVFIRPVVLGCGCRFRCAVLLRWAGEFRGADIQEHLRLPTDIGEPAGRGRQVIGGPAPAGWQLAGTGLGQPIWCGTHAAGLSIPGGRPPFAGMKGPESPPKPWRVPGHRRILTRVEPVNTMVSIPLKARVGHD